MTKKIVVLVPFLLFLPITPRAQDRSAGQWRFAVSGDSRNCGDVVMPAIAQSALAHHVDFYWHLGDFRLGSGVDEDMRKQYDFSRTPYPQIAWDDFLNNQIGPFGKLTVYLGIGNHELYMHGATQADQKQSHADVIQKFSKWMRGSQAAYYHWKKPPVDFINLDNSEAEGFDAAQLAWFKGVLKDDAADEDIRTVVVGMHRALPNSLGCGHSMNGDPPRPTDSDARKKQAAEENAASTESGRQAYRDLLEWKKETGKYVYVLASHSHFFMQDIFETAYWNNAAEKDRGVLPGWIVGTAGAVRYQLPEDLPSQTLGATYTYGYLLGTVEPDGQITFDFQQVTEKDVPTEILAKYKKSFVDFCFLANRDMKPHPPADSCQEK